MAKKIFTVLLCAFIGIICTSCRSTEVDSTGIGERNQYLRGRIDSTVKSLDRELVDCNSEIQQCLERSRRIEDLGERLKYLTTEYFKCFKQLQDTSDKAHAELQLVEEAIYNSNDGLAHTDSSRSSSVIPGTDPQD